MSKSNVLKFLLISMILLFAVSSINAADVTDNQNVVSDTIQATGDIQSDISEIQDVKSDVKEKKVIKKESQVTKNEKKELNKKDTTLTTTNKTVKKAQTHIITNTTIKDYFKAENNYTLPENVTEGDTLDIQGKISGLGKNFTISINKPVNIISSTQDSLIDLNTTAGNYFGESPGSSFAIITGADHTNITGINLHNTQFWISAVKHVVIDNVSAVVEDQRVGSGVGQTTIRNYAENITLKNSYISTKNNGGSSSFVIAAANYCTIDNCTIRAEGQVGNLLYLTTFNVNITDPVFNSYNTIKNCRIMPASLSAISMAVVITGVGNVFDNNTIVAGGFSTQWGGGVVNNQTFRNNKLLNGGMTAVFANSTYINNTISGGLTVSNSTVENNIVKGTTTIRGTSQLRNNNLTNITVSDKLAVNSIIENNNITGLVQVTQGNITLKNNVIASSENLALNVKTSNNTIINNIITAGPKAGDDAVVIDKTTNTYENNTPETGVVYNITDGTYSNFFDADGNILTNVTDYSKLNFQGVFNNKNFIIKNKKVTITGEDALLNNGTITVSDDSLVWISDIQMNTENANAIVLNTQKNKINNVNITHTGVSTTILVNGDNTLISNVNIIKNNEQADSSLNVIEITSSNNNINNVNINATSNGEVKAIVFTANNKITNNIVKSNTINIKASKATAIALNGDINLTALNSNTIKLETTEDAQGILINGNTNNNTISSNKINITSDNNAKGIIAANATQTGLKEEIQSNQISITSKNAAGITVNFADKYMNAVISSNKILINTTQQVNGIYFNGENLTTRGNTINVTSQQNIADNSAITLVGKNIISNGYTINAINASALIITDSDNVLINSSNSMSNSTNPIEVVNSNNVEIVRLTANTTSNNTIELKNVKNSSVINSTLIGNETYGGDTSVSQDANCENITLLGNTPTIYILKNDTYNQLFDKNGLLNITYTNGTEIYLKSDIYGVNIKINEYIPIINKGNYTFYNTTISYIGDMKTGYQLRLENINIINTNKTAFILNITSSNEITLMYSNIKVTGEQPAFIAMTTEGNTYRSTLSLLYSNVTVEGVNPTVVKLNGYSNTTSLQSTFHLTYSNVTLKGENKTIFADSEKGSLDFTTNNITITGKDILMLKNNDSSLSFRGNNLIMTADNVVLLNETNYTASRASFTNNNITITAKNPVVVMTTERNNSQYTITGNNINVTVDTPLNGRTPLIYALGSTASRNAINVTDSQGESILGNEAIVAKSVSGNTPDAPFHVFVNVTNSTLKYNQDGNITLSLYSLYNQTVSGTYTVDVNGETYKVENGTKITVPVNVKAHSITLTMNYVDPEGIYSSVENNTQTLNILKGDAQIQVTVNSEIYAGQSITLTAVISDNGELIKDGYVAFKLNGVTLKDANGNRIKVRVINGVATLIYTIPSNYAAKDYLLTAVFSNGNYDRVEVNQTVTIIPSNVFIQPTSVYYENGKLMIKADIKDAITNKDVAVRTKVTLKINGKTFVDRMVIENGTITIAQDIKLSNGIKTLTIISGPNKKYNVNEIKVNFMVQNTPVKQSKNATQITANDNLKAKV